MPSTINADNGVSSGSAGLKSSADSSGVLSLQTNGTTAVTVDTSQNVGVGTASPAARLSVDSGSAGLMANFNSSAANGGYLRFQSSGTSIGDIGTAAQTVSGSTSDFSINSRPSGALVFGTSNTERMRIDSSGNVGIGTTSPNTKFAINGGGIIAQADGDYFGGGATYYNNNWRNTVTNQGGWTVRNTSGTFTIWTGSSPGTAGSVISDFAERLRITSSGGVAVGTTSAFSGNTLLTAAVGVAAVNSGSTPPAFNWYNSNAGTDLKTWRIIVDSAGAFFWQTVNDAYNSATTRATFNTAGEFLCGGGTDNGPYNFQCNGTGVWGAGAYVNGSDARIKDNIAPLQSGLDTVAKLNPVTFQYKESWSKDTSTQPGFIAQELQTALADTNYVDGVVRQGGEYMSVSYQTLIPVLTKAIQELKAEVDSLKSQLAAKG